MNKLNSTICQFVNFHTLIFSHFSDVAAFDDDGEDGDIGRVHAGYARGLCERLRTVLLQLFPAFKPHRHTLVIVEPRRNLDLLIQLGPFRRLLLLLDVRRIMTHNL